MKPKIKLINNNTELHMGELRLVRKASFRTIEMCG